MCVNIRSWNRNTGSDKEQWKGLWPRPFRKAAGHTPKPRRGLLSVLAGLASSEQRKVRELPGQNRAQPSPVLCGVKEANAGEGFIYTGQAAAQEGAQGISIPAGHEQN